MAAVLYVADMYCKHSPRYSAHLCVYNVNPISYMTLHVIHWRCQHIFMYLYIYCWFNYILVYYYFCSTYISAIIACIIIFLKSSIITALMKPLFEPRKTEQLHCYASLKYHTSIFTCRHDSITSPMLSNTNSKALYIYSNTTQCYTDRHWIAQHLLTV